MSLRTLAEKSSDADLLREMVGFEPLPAEILPDLKLPFGDSIALVGVAPSIFGPRPLFVDFGADLDVPAGSGIADRRAGQAAHGNLDLDDAGLV